MAIVVTSVNKSFPLTAYAYAITGLVAGANTITLPTPPLAGSFPPADDWLPTSVYVFPYNVGAVGAIVSIDPTTIAETTAGVVSFTLYSGGSTDAFILVA